MQTERKPEKIVNLKTGEIAEYEIYPELSEVEQKWFVTIKKLYSTEPDFIRFQDTGIECKESSSHDELVEYLIEYWEMEDISFKFLSQDIGLDEYEAEVTFVCLNCDFKTTDKKRILFSAGWSFGADYDNLEITLDKNNKAYISAEHCDKCYAKVKTITQLQAKKIRKAISKKLGSQKRYFNKKGTWVISRPFSDTPELLFWDKAHWDLSEPEPLQFVAGYHREEKIIPSLEDLQKIKFVEYHDGRYSFNELEIFEHEPAQESIYSFVSNLKYTGQITRYFDSDTQEYDMTSANREIKEGNKLYVAKWTSPEGYEIVKTYN